MKHAFTKTIKTIATMQILVIISAMATFMFAANHATAEQADSPVISVSAVGKATAEPDMALVSFGVVREAPAAREALTANNKAMNQVLAALDEAGIEKKDIQTSNFNISPRFHYPKRSSDGSQPPPRIVGYIVSNTVAIRVRDLSKIGGLLDNLVSQGVNSGGNIRFLNQNPKDILKTARTTAVKNAVEKAETLAEAAGVKLGQIMEIREDVHEPRPAPLARSVAVEAQASPADVPIARGENSYSIRVQMKWAISP